MNDTNDILLPKEDNQSIEDSVSTITTYNTNSYVCGTCKCVFSSNMTASRCVLCNGTNLSNNEVNLSNAKFIPFCITINNAIDDYKNKIKNIFVSKVFKDKKTIQNMKKVYLPAYLVDANVKGLVKFFGADRINSGETIKYELEYDSNFDFNNLLVSGYSKIDDVIFNNICTYQYDKAVPYTDDQLNDAYSISYDLVPLEVSNKINNRVMRYCLSEIRENIQHPLKKLHKNEMDVQIRDSNKIYVPIYLLNIKHNNKNYSYIMNGQSGKSYIEVKYSKVAIIIFSLLLFVIIFVCAFLFAYFL